MDWPGQVHCNSMQSLEKGVNDLLKALNLKYWRKRHGGENTRGRTYLIDWTKNGRCHQQNEVV